MSTPPPEQQVFVLEWGRRGPPVSGTYHPDPDCWTLHRSDSDRDVVLLPWPRSAVEADAAWDECGVCGDDPTTGEGGPQLDVEAIVGPIDDPWYTVEQEQRGDGRYIPPEELE